MASIEPRKNKKGEITSYRIIVSGGIDSNGEQIKYKKSWKPPKKNMTERQIEKALNLAAAKFELDIKAGYQLDNRQTFAQYANYVLDLKERNGVKTSSIDSYLRLTDRTYQAIGHMKLADIRPQHLNAFYKKLGEPGMRLTQASATPIIDIRAWLKAKGYSIDGFAKKCGLASSTLRAAADGRSVREDSAKKIAAAMDVSIKNVFDIQRDMSRLTNTTILEYHRFISAVLSQAEKELLIPFNPAAKASPPSSEKHEPDYYEPDTVKRILDALDEAPLKWRAATYLLIDTGCRRGEVMGLRWENVYLDDPENAIVMIDRNRLYSTRKGLYEDSTKTNESRALVIAPETAGLLREWKSLQEEYRDAAGDAWINSGYVFTQDTGKGMHPDSLNSWLSDFSARNGLPHIHPHAFRHTAASIMVSEQMDIITVAAELGHADPHTTAKIYAHELSLARAKAAGVRRKLIQR